MRVEETWEWTSNICSSYPRMRSVKSFFEHSAEDASFLLKKQYKVSDFLYHYYDQFSCARGMLGPASTRLTLVLLLLFSERLSVLAESLLGADKSSWGWEARVHRLLVKVSSPPGGMQLNGGAAAWRAPETVSLLPKALGISWTSHWTSLLPPGITMLL